MPDLVLETYTSGPEPVHRRAPERGPMLRDGVCDVDSRIADDAAHDRCFELMQTDERSLREARIAACSDLVSFEARRVGGWAEAPAPVEIGRGGA
jgi:hypothetical protein